MTVTIKLDDLSNWLIQHICPENTLLEFVFVGGIARGCNSSHRKTCREMPNSCQGLVVELQRLQQIQHRKPSDHKLRFDTTAGLKHFMEGPYEKKDACMHVGENSKLGFHTKLLGSVFIYAGTNIGWIRIILLTQVE